METKASDGVAEDARPPMTEEDELAVAIERGHGELASGRPKEAAEILEDAQFVARRLGDDGAEAEISGYLAQAYLRLEMCDEAARCASEALAIAKARGDGDAAKHFQNLLLTARSSPEELEMSTAFGDGRTALFEGDSGRAIPRLERALELAGELGHRVAAGASAQLLAEAYHDAGRSDDAAKQLDHALELATTLGDEQAVARAKELKARMESEGSPLESGIVAELKWGQEALAEGEFEKGIRHLEQARDQARAESQGVPEASACGMLAQALLELDRRDEAIVEAERALELATEIGQESAIADFRSLLEVAKASPESHALAKAIQQGTLALEVGELDLAIERLTLAHELALKTGQVVAEALASGQLATIYSKKGERELALQHAKRALEISESRDEPKAAEHFRKLVSELSKKNGAE